MLRVFVANTAPENWEACVKYSIFGLRPNDPYPSDLYPGDIILLRISGKPYGVAAIWSLEQVTKVDKDVFIPWADGPYEWVLKCTPIVQLPRLFSEDFTTSSQLSSKIPNYPATRIQLSITLLKNWEARKYLELILHEFENELTQAISLNGQTKRVDEFLKEVIDQLQDDEEPKALADNKAPFIEEARELHGNDLSYWWVNQGSTYEYERTGGYIWAPQKTSGGKVLSFHTRLRDLRKGDIIFHYANGKLRATSEVVEETIEATPPSDSIYGSPDRLGLLAKLNYRDLPVPIDLKDIPLRLRTKKGGPFDKNGKVKEGYLFGLEQNLAEWLLAHSEPAVVNAKDWDGDEGQAERRYWIFQANPRYFDLAGALSELSQIRFLTQQNSSKIHEGDVVFLWESGKNAGVVAVGTIVADPSVLQEQEEAIRFVKDPKKFSGGHLRVPVHIDQVLSKRIKRNLLLVHPVLGSLGVLRSPRGTNYAMTKSQVKAMIELVSKESGASIDFPQENEPRKVELGIPVSPLGQRLNYSPVGDDDPIWKQVQELLSIGIRNIVFIGPPGTSKTEYALRIGSRLAEYQPQRFHNIQLHPSYGYEDFVMGYVPTENPKNPSPFERKPKLFLKACRAAREGSPEKRYVLVIDELNRSDPSRVFGEALTYIERRDELFEIPYSDERWMVPSNLVILATMNPYDKSIADLDDAMFRRFEGKITMDPDTRLLREMIFTINHVDPTLGGNLVAFFEWLNKEMENRVGHAHFRSVKDAHTLNIAWNHSILPFLKRELRYDKDKLERIELKFHGEFQATAVSPVEP